tara:strand:+ start:22 stop:774 length:753 start_codon:yes stop_codon:yes gene_type:complete
MEEITVLVQKDGEDSSGPWSPRPGRDSLNDNHIEQPSSKNENKKIKVCCKIVMYIIFVILVLIIALSICFSEGYLGVKLFEKIDGKEITARAWPHITYTRPMSCSDYYNPKNGDYGCCSVSDHRGTYNISWMRILKDDINGTNCPSYEKLINKYILYINEFFEPLNCTLKECCKVNYAIDNSIRRNHTLPQNRMDPRYEIEVPVNSNHDNCNIHRFIGAYEMYYENPKIGYGFLIIIFLIIILWCLEINK